MAHRSSVKYCGPSLYVRTLLFGNDDRLGVHPARRAEFVVMATPATAYFSNETGISLWLTTDYTRTSRGGTGSAKCAGNYAGSLLPQVLANQLGCDQVLHTVEHEGERFIDEAGTMNVFAVTDDDMLLAACVVSSVSTVLHDGESIRIGTSQPGPKASALREHLVGIQVGRLPDHYGWTMPITTK